MGVETNKNLRQEVKQLKDIVNLLLNNWKSKHPEDFKIPEGYGLLSPSEPKTNTQQDKTFLGIVPPICDRSELGNLGTVTGEDNPAETRKGCEKEFNNDDYDEIICGEEIDFWDDETNQSFYGCLYCPECTTNHDITNKKANI